MSSFSSVAANIIGEPPLKPHPMHRFFLPPDAFRGDVVYFPPDLARQLRVVLRLQPGQEVMALDGKGRAFRVTLVEVGKQRAIGRIRARMPATGEPAGELMLCPAISKGERFEWVLQKGVELGVTTFQPIITRRTVRRTPGAGRWERWRRIIREAAEQSGRGRLPRLLDPIPLAQALAQARGFALMPSTLAQMPVGQVLGRVTWPVTLFIGPEGGFDPDEVAEAQAAGVVAVTLGPRILRTETAAIVMVALVMAALGELDRPALKIA